MGQTHLIDRTALIGSAEVVVLLIERDDDRTIVHLRTSSSDDARAIGAARPSLVDATGQRIDHVVTHIGGTGIETHVTLVFAATSSSELRISTADGREVFSVRLP